MMKRTLTFLLTFALMLGCTAVLTIVPSAETQTPEKINVSYVGTNYDDWNGTAGKDIVVFNDTTKAYSVNTAGGTEPAYVMAKFDQPTVMTKVTVTVAHANANRARAGSLYGSVDGEEWVKIGTAPDAGWGNGVTVQIPISSTTAFNYVIYEQAKSLVGYWYTLGGIEVYGSPIEGTRQDVSFVSYAGGDYNDGSANADKVFQMGNTSVWNSADLSQNAGEAWVVGQFAEPTVIKQVFIGGHTSFAARLINTVVEGSTDGTTWVELNGIGSKTPDSPVVLLETDDDTAYTYIRVKRTSDNGGLFSLMSVSVYGYSIVPVMKGYQETVPVNGVQSVRLIGTVDVLDYSRLGMRISATYTDRQTGESKTVSIDKDCTSIYNSLTASDAEGTIDVITAEELGGKYIFAVVINGVPADVGEVVFAVTPYAEQGETVVTGQQITVTYDNGVAVVPEA